jgi:hypothetical protein
MALHVVMTTHSSVPCRLVSWAQRLAPCLSVFSRVLQLLFHVFPCHGKLGRFCYRSCHQSGGRVIWWSSGPAVGSCGRVVRLSACSVSAFRVFPCHSGIVAPGLSVPWGCVSHVVSVRVVSTRSLLRGVASLCQSRSCRAMPYHKQCEPHAIKTRSHAC